MDEVAGICRRSQDLAVVTAADRITLLDLNALDRPPLILEGTGMAIWQLLDGTLDRAGIVEQLSRQYAAPADEVAAGVDTFLASLVRLDLLKHGSGHP